MSEGSCRVCGCTEERACVDAWGDACSWSDTDPSICTFCEEGVACEKGGSAEGRASFAGSGSLGFLRRGG